MLYYMRKFFSIFDKFVDRAGYWHGFYFLLAGSGVIGAITGWLAKGVSAVDQYGALGWWSAALLGALLFSAISLTLAVARYAWVHAKARNKWVEKTDEFNPMDRDFKDKRLLLSDLMHPLNKNIKGKRFYDCELIGPQNIFMYQNAYMKGVAFADCSIFVLWPDSKGSLWPGSAAIMQDVEMHGGSICGATLLISPEMVKDFRDMGCKFSTLTGDPVIDTQWPQANSEETRR